MKKSSFVSAFILGTLVLLGACERRDGEPAQSAANTPHGAVMGAVSAMRTGDFTGFLKNAMSEAEYQEARQEWETARTEAIDPRKKPN